MKKTLLLLMVVLLGIIFGLPALKRSTPENAKLEGDTVSFDVSVLESNQAEKTLFRVCDTGGAVRHQSVSKSNLAPVVPENPYLGK